MLFLIAGLYLVVGCALLFSGVKSTVSRMTGMVPATLTFMSFCLLAFGAAAGIAAFILD